MQFRSCFLLLFALVVSLGAHAQAARDSSYTAKMAAPGVRMITVAGKYQVWTQKIGQGKIKLLLLHGGPGNTHEYFENFPEYLRKEGVEIYFYDQLGSFYSDHAELPQEKDLWTIARAVDEVEQVRQGLGLSQFYLLGHSWGGILALEYASKHPAQLKGLIVSNMGYDAPRYNQHRLELYTQIIGDEAAAQGKPIAGLDTMSTNAKNKLATPTVLATFQRRHMMRLPQAPEAYARSQAHVSRRYAMALLPAMGAWNFAERLASIHTPTLLIGATHDFIPPGQLQFMQQRMPNSQVYICPDGSHYSMWDDAGRYFPALIRFLRKTERKG